MGAFALSEPNVGSDAKNVQTSYRKEGNRYILNGRKKWISFAAIADFSWWQQLTKQGKHRHLS
ncbi:acyl-CoA dehydrogenase family protein [Paenibacillus larvae]|nr:acyl-CoA dehydrogenase family protein [Paenibacillus larvae]MDT2261013.1 acyl-CoA dehydrogenase family protein [Paenibacillus larvae]